jgi:hypothetical protein
MLPHIMLVSGDFVLEFYNNRRLSFSSNGVNPDSINPNLNSARTQ